jgi:hypothetical protein
MRITVIRIGWEEALDLNELTNNFEKSYRLKLMNSRAVDELIANKINSNLNEDE